MNAPESGGAAVNASARERTIAMEGARLRLQAAQLAHLNAVADAVAAGVPPEDVLAELREITRDCAEVMAGRRVGGTVQ